MKRLERSNCCPVLIPPPTSPVFGQRRIYMISMGSMVIGSNMLQSHLLSTTTMKRLLLGICWITKDLPITAQTARNRDLRKEVGEGWRESWELDWQVDKAHGYDVNFHLCQRICLWVFTFSPGAMEMDWRDSTGYMSRGWLVLPPAVNKHTVRRHR